MIQIKQHLIIHAICALSAFSSINAQSFYFGADQSYVNEMEDCGAIFKENGMVKDVHQIFEDHNCNLVRLRLWHTPSWYDDLNDGKRYSDLADVKKSIQRAKAHHMEVLLDFHLSDNWADPSKQIIPAAWLPIADNLPVLKDSLYNYIFYTLSALANENLLPEMVQIGNETNRGILLTPEQNQSGTMDWDRNSQLFNAAIQAVRDFSGDVRIALHLADPSKSEWWFNEFEINGVTDYDIIAMSYYWGWHKPTSIAETGLVIERLKSNFPSKEVMIVETGYIWTTDWQDQAGNIITEVHPDYAPASPLNQKQWLIDLTQEVIYRGGTGVIYWEPSWVSTGCWTQWGQGSHQEHATFFDFDHQLIIPGGIEWMEYAYITTKSENLDLAKEVKITPYSHDQKIVLEFSNQIDYQDFHYLVSDTAGHIILKGFIHQPEQIIKLPGVRSGIVIISVSDNQSSVSRKVFIAPQ